MSCYLNLGIVGVFGVVDDVLKCRGGGKMEDEILKWREGAHLHCFYKRDYCGVDNVPNWARRWFSEGNSSVVERGDDKVGESYVRSLERGEGECGVWNAMQRYLVGTGELHNNVRMTWGRTLVMWLKGGKDLGEIVGVLKR